MMVHGLGQTIVPQVGFPDMPVLILTSWHHGTVAGDFHVFGTF